MKNQLRKLKWKRLFRRKPYLRWVFFGTALLLEVLLAAAVVLAVHFFVTREVPGGADAASVSEATEASGSEAFSSEDSSSETVPPETDVPTESDPASETPSEAPSSEAETMPPTEPPTERETDPRPTEPPATTPEATEPSLPPGPEDVYVKEGNDLFDIPATATRIFLGDSRFQGVYYYTTHDAVLDGFLTGGGEGYRWFEERAIPEIERLLAAGYPFRDIYFNLGVNDCAYSYKSESETPEIKYAAKLNEFAARHPELRIYFISVGPGDEEKGTYGGRVDLALMNAEVRKFNAYIAANCPTIRYVDGGEYLERDGFVSSDGVHYDRATYQKLYQYIIEKAR